MTRSRIIRSAISAFVGLVAALSTSIVSATPAEAAAGDAQITNSSLSVGFIQVCRDFGPSTCASGIGTLYPGQDSYSKFGWNDTDGFQCSATKRYLVMSVWYTCSTLQWVKVSGGLIGRINVPIRVYNK